MIVDTTASDTNGRAGLSNLSTMQLSDDRQHMLDAALAVSGGSTIYRARKEAEAREVLALGQRAAAGRMQVVFLDMSAALRMIVHLKVPVPCRPGEDGELRVAHFADLGITYPPETLREARPGTSFVQVLTPSNVWHANVLPDLGQPLCLGASLPPGIRVRELILMSYGALSMQSVMVDIGDAAGVLHREAAQWWQQNLRYAPLSRTPFLSPDPAEGRRAPKGGC